MVGTHLLPPNLLKLFAPRPALPYLKPTGRDPDLPLKSRAKKPPTLSVAETLALIREEREAKELAAESADVEVKDEAGEPQEEGETKESVKDEGSDDKTKEGIFTLCGEEAFKLRVEARKNKHTSAIQDGIKNYNPADDEEVCGDPYKTLFVGRLPFVITEQDLRREFEMYGPLERIRVVRNKDGKSRGYAFIIYEREKDMKAAYKDAEGLKLMNRRLLIDVERGRTVKGWRPRRLGGGLGGRPKPVLPGAAPPEFGFPQRGGGFGGRGGGRGGFVQRGGFQGGRGGFNDRGPPGGGRGGFQGGGGGYGGGGFQPPQGSDNGYGNRGGFRGGFQGGDRGGGSNGFAPRGGGSFGGPPGAGNFQRGGGIGSGGPPRGGFQGGYGGPPGGNFGPPGGGYGGGPPMGAPGGFQGQSGPDGGYPKRGGDGDFGGDAKRPRY